MDITTHASQWGYDWDSKAIKVGFQWILNRDSNSQLVRYFHHDDWSNVKSGNQSSIRCCNIKLAFYCFQDDYLLQHNGECRGFKLKGVQYTAINLKRTFICPRWHSLKSPAFAGFFALPLISSKAKKRPSCSFPWWHPAPKTCRAILSFSTARTVWMLPSHAHNVWPWWSPTPSYWKSPAAQWSRWNWSTHSAGWMTMPKHMPDHIADLGKMVIHQGL